MNKLIKWSLIGLVTAALIVVAAAIILPLVIDPNNYKDNISAAVRDQTGRDLAIGGEIQWTVFPWLGFVLSDLELSNRPGFGDQPMLSIREASASIKLMPLLSRRVEVGSVSLDGLNAKLRRNADGANNWEDLNQAEQSSASSTAAGEGELESIVVSEIAVTNADVTWDDAGSVTRLTEFELNASNIELGQPFDLEGGFAITLSESEVAGKARFGGRIDSAQDGSRYEIQNLEFIFEGQSGKEGDVTSIEATVKANADFDMKADAANLKDFELSLFEMKVTGELAVSTISTSPQFEGGLRVAEFSPRSLMRSMGMPELDTGDDQALTNVSAQMDFAGSSDSARMSNLVVKFDKSTFEGNLAIQGFDRPDLGFDFKIDEINLDDYLPTKPAESEPEVDLTVDLFRGFTGGGVFNVGKLVVAGLSATDVSMKMSSDGSKVRLFPIGANVYDGTFEGDVAIDARGSRPQLSASQSLSGIQAEGLLVDLTGNARLEGTGDFRMKITTDLTNSASIRKALNGSVSLNFLDGAIVGINVAESIRSAKALLGRQEAETEDSDEQEQDPKTDFSELSLTGTFNEGVFSSNDLMMRSPLLRVTGKGKINLVDETIDYLVKPTLVDSLEGQGGTGSEDLGGIPIPVKLSGNLYEPEVGIDFVGAIAESQKARIDEKKDELKNKLLGKLLGEDEGADGADNSEESETEEEEDPAKSLLNSLFGGKRDKDDKKDDPDGGPI